ncbi:SDR family NAD(P)-dependent oxidoreductase [Amnibacterium flavum]|uniref:Short-chain dehydrogenase n=1 Tax=Amnibacterium flavum TaxID=2173173 RepID=A0A2V1HLL5_9MICO|nr:SDR family NAD(P)-dependent oxidoreductase [Amnibacterium flavum]PVZ93536.1 short-chain dehydrogenase [Amnibacterium flavum]
MTPTRTPARALITGATAGLGAEFARQLAAAGHPLVLVARDLGRLEKSSLELGSRYGVDVEVLAADLSEREELARVELRLLDVGSPIGYLVNNAGYGLREPFDENDIEIEQRHLDVLVTAPLRLSHAALRGMLARRSGVILNVASVAAYTPRSTYGAAKAYILSFTRWANINYRRSGVTFTAVAPGFVHTEFHSRMEVGSDFIPSILWLDAPYVVRAALRAARRGRAVTVPSLRYKVIAALARIAPPRIAAAGALKGR